MYKYWIKEYESAGRTNDKIFADFMNKPYSSWSLRILYLYW